MTQRDEMVARPGTPPPNAAARHHALFPRPAQLLAFRTLSVGAFVLLLSCRPPADEALLRLAPSLPPDLAAHLANDTSEEFGRYASRLTPGALGAASMTLLSSLPDSLPGFEEREKALLPYLRTVTATLRDRFQLGYLDRAVTAYERRPVEERITCAAIVRAQRMIARDGTLGVPERAARYEALIDRAAPFRDVISLGDLISAYSELLPRLNRRSEIVENLLRGSEHALAYGDTALSCQFLGALGSFYAQTGDDRSMKQWWDRALVLARANHSWHEARILSFYASYYRGRGDPARTVTLLGQAADRCRELRADEAEIRFLFAQLNLFAELSCWDLVDRGLARADILIRAGEGSWRAVERQLWAARVQSIRMRLAAARHQDAEAVRGARDIVRLLRDRPAGPDRERLFLAAAEVLAQCGHRDEAGTLLAHVLLSCEESGIPELLPAVHLQDAELRLQSGDLVGAENSISHFAGLEEEDSGAPEAWIRHDLVAARLAWQRQDRSRALLTLAAALSRLEVRCAGLGSSPEAFLTLGRFQELRSLFHEIEADDPAAGYLFESGWSDLRFRRRVVHDGSSPAAVARAAVSKRVTALPRLSPLPPTTVHCVFLWGEREVVRWTRHGDVIDRQVLAADPVDLRARVLRLSEEFQSASPPPEPLAPGSARELNDLARLLLPEEILRPNDRRTLLLSREGALAQLPFEALNIAATGYQPLLATRDVAYLNSLAGRREVWEPDPVASAESGPREGALVITDPTYGIELTRRWSALNERLPNSVAEARQFSESSARSILLRGNAASRAAVMSHWESARELYLAAHVVRDPELSYQVHIPLAGDGDAPGLLTTGDIQSADLSRCALVVLSGCGTGVRYAAGSAESPSLADMFVKAGARAVVQTGWNVRDADGAAVMHLFNDRYAAAPGAPVRALCEARRELIRRGASPAAWAAYSILIADPGTIEPDHKEMEMVWNPAR